MPFKETAIAPVPKKWLSAFPGDEIAALNIAAQTVPKMQTDAGKVRGFFLQQYPGPWIAYRRLGLLVNRFNFTCIRL